MPLGCNHPQRRGLLMSVLRLLIVGAPHGGRYVAIVLREAKSGVSSEPNRLPPNRH